MKRMSNQQITQKIHLFAVNGQCHSGDKEAMETEPNPKRQRTESRSHLQQLLPHIFDNDELLTKILSHLKFVTAPQCRAVNKKFQWVLGEDLKINHRASATQLTLRHFPLETFPL